MKARIKISIVFFISIIGMSFKTLNSSEEVKFFTGTWKDLFVKAQSENKPVMVYMTATWCGLCEFTEDSVFTIDTAYNYLNENFICYKTDGKSKEARKLRAEYPVEGYPCYFYFNPQGKLLRQTNTFMFSAQLQKDAEKAMKKYKRGF
ncbi:MAG: thioredoxin family protein [Bacteroidota bacterium]|nr:thioredoxin family protein [Bacteroidota bacterium]